MWLLVLTVLQSTQTTQNMKEWKHRRSLVNAAQLHNDNDNTTVLLDSSSDNIPSYSRAQMWPQAVQRPVWTAGNKAFNWPSETYVYVQQLTTAQRARQAQLIATEWLTDRDASDAGYADLAGSRPNPLCLGRIQSKIWPDPDTQILDQAGSTKLPDIQPDPDLDPVHAINRETEWCHWLIDWAWFNVCTNTI